jgi:Bacteriophage Mu, GemA protein
MDVSTGFTAAYRVTASPNLPEICEMSISKPKLVLLHTAKNKLHLSDPEYRTILREAAGVNSARDLDDDGFKQVLTRFQALGFKTLREQRSFGDRPGFATPAQLELIRYRWRQYTGGHDEGLEHWIEKWYGISALRFLDSDAASKALTALKRMAEYPKTASEPKR